jgi:predicted transcriptional regulator
MSTKEWRRAQKRKVMPGYPLEVKMKTPEEVEAYFSKDRLVCLRCGKTYKSLGMHLKTIHEMEPEEYKEIYGLPYYRGLIGSDTRQIKAEIAKSNYESGIWEASKERAEKARKKIGFYGDRRQEYRDELTDRNLRKMNEGKTGEEAKRRRLQSKWGSQEHKDKLRARPQCSPPSPNFVYYWVGRKQTREHVVSRTGAEPKD